MNQVVGVFCDPSTYPSSEGLKSWVQQGVVPVVGLHPKRRFTEEGFDRLKVLLEQPDVAGLGEVCLDRSEPYDSWADQMFKLNKDPVFVEAHSHLGPSRSRTIASCRRSLDVPAVSAPGSPLCDQGSTYTCPLLHSDNSCLGYVD